MYNAPLPRDQLRDRLSGTGRRRSFSHAQHDLFSVVRKHFDDDRIRTLFTSHMHVITTESVRRRHRIPGNFSNVTRLHVAGRRGEQPVAGAAPRVVEGRRRRSHHRRRCEGDRGQERPRHRRQARRRTTLLNGRRLVASAIDVSTTMAHGGPRAFSRRRCVKCQSLALGQPQPGDAASRAQAQAALSRRDKFDPVI